MAANPELKQGDHVEITSKEQKMRGTLFPATVVGPGVNNKSIIVKYKTLTVNNGDGFKPLVEAIELGLVRPSQPPDNHLLQFGDQVDAFFGGGWWEGYITEVFNDSMFLVYFRFANQQFTFHNSKLRLHREWVKGSWLPPLQEQPREVSSPTEANSSKPMTIKFEKGTQVEVTSNEDGFEGSWFAATIMEQVKEDKYLVKYASLRTDDDADFLTEEVKLSQIRPCPPEAVVVDAYSSNGKVDALYNDGWWEGVITKVLANSNYKVYFKHSDEELKIRRSKLRPHQDWVDGQWVLAYKA